MGGSRCRRSSTSRRKAAAEEVRNTVLDLARTVAHGVERPAAPLTAYLLGMAVGRAAGDPVQVTTEYAQAVAALLARFGGQPRGKDGSHDGTT